jgi:p-aminobenzoyl-glutamate transporter AbgT
MLYNKKMSSSFLDNLLESVLKRQMPYLVGGTITGTIMAYYYGFLSAVIANSVIWFAVSTLINKYYWKYTGFKEEFHLALKYIGRIKKKKSNDKLVIKYDKHTKRVNTKRYLSSMIRIIRKLAI